jgi:hypothetical protein
MWRGKLELFRHFKRLEGTVVDTFAAEYAGGQFEYGSSDWKFSVANLSRPNVDHRYDSCWADHCAHLAACASFWIYVQLSAESVR